MSKRSAPEPRHRRWYVAFSALCLIVGLQIAAVPPEIFDDPGVCFMECNVEGRSCCCKKLLGIEIAPHAPEAEADGRLAPLEIPCRDVCATFANKAPGDDLWLFSKRRHASALLAGTDQATASAGSHRPLDHSDPSTLPRPPPVSARS